MYADTDWAGCAKTRKSTSGGCLVVGCHLIKSWSATQSLVSLSSGEAEYYGLVKGSGVGLGYQSLLRDLGLDLPLRAWTDSTVSMGICGRSGLGKLRHIDTQCLWLQQKVRTKAMELRKVKGTENPADLFTKHITSASHIEGLLKILGCEYRDGRLASAPALREGAGTQAGTQLNLAAQDLMVIGERSFPKTLWEGEEVPEAWSYPQTCLPHQCADMDALFPEAIAAPEAGDVDPPGRCILEERFDEDRLNQEGDSCQKIDDSAFVVDL